MKAQSATRSVAASTTMGRFAALDFETADSGFDSACAVSVVLVDGLTIVKSVYALIRPPRRWFEFTHVHGIRWSDVADKPAFCDVWPVAADLLRDVDFVAAHSASFDRSVLMHCCTAADVPVPALKFQCTVKLARQSWDLRPTKLPDVCRHLGIALQHHHAESDARACAEIVIAARRQGLPLSPFLGRYSGRLAAQS
jgi:DNA polymerase III subunit epsilon